MMDSRRYLMAKWLPAFYMKVPEGYVAFLEEVPGANTQGATLEEARANLHEAVDLVLEANRALAEESLRGQDFIKQEVFRASSSRDQRIPGAQDLPRPADP